MGKLLSLYGMSAVVMILIDGIWIYVVANPLYKQTFGDALRARPDGLSALLAYACIVGAALFLLYPVVRTMPSVAQQFLYGFMFGFFLYGLYAFTSLSLFSVWDWKTAVLDALWGGVLYGVVGVIMVWLSMKLSV